MAIEDQIRERLRKVEALFLGGATPGERHAAGAAAERLRAKLAQAALLDRPIEMKFTFSDPWSVRLFLALCRRHGFKPFRYARQRFTTVMVSAPRQAFEAVVWREFNELHADLQVWLDQTTDRLIRETIHADVADAGIAPAPTGRR